MTIADLFTNLFVGYLTSFFFGYILGKSISSFHNLFK